MGLKGLKRKIGKAKREITKIKAKAKGMTVKEYQRYKQDLKRKGKEERLKHEKWKIEQKYKRKREPRKRGATGVGILDTLADISANVTRNLEREVLGLPSPRRKRKKTKKQKRKRKRK